MVFPSSISIGEEEGGETDETGADSTIVSVSEIDLFMKAEGERDRKRIEHLEANEYVFTKQDYSPTKKRDDEREIITNLPII